MSEQTETAPAIMPLRGHVSPETAYVVEDYPYGFKLRCRIRYWIETKKGHGQRLVTQTTDPRKAYTKWNAPKPSTYTALRVLYLNPENNHTESAGLGLYADETEIRSFAERYAGCLTDQDQHTIEILIARARANARVTWSVRAPGDTGPQQTPEEQIAIMRRATAIELAKLRNEGEPQS